MTDIEHAEHAEQIALPIPEFSASFPPPRRKAGRKKGIPNSKPYEFKDRAAICERRRQIRNEYLATHPDYEPPRNGGRDRGGHHPDTVRPGERRVVFLMLESTRETIKRCAKSDGITAIEFMHELAETLRSSGRYAELFVPGTESGQERQTDEQ